MQRSCPAAIAPLFFSVTRQLTRGAHCIIIDSDLVTSSRLRSTLHHLHRVFRADNIAFDSVFTVRLRRLQYLWPVLAMGCSAALANRMACLGLCPTAPAGMPCDDPRIRRTNEMDYYWGGIDRVVWWVVRGLRIWDGYPNGRPLSNFVLGRNLPGGWLEFSGCLARKGGTPYALILTALILHEGLR